MPSDELFCINCGAMNRADARFCYSCGAYIVQDATGQNEVVNPTGLLPVTSVLRHRYHIVKRVGRGGFGAVYKAEDLKFNHAIRAVKELGRSRLTPAEIQRVTEAFRQEAMLLANLMHANLPRIYDHFMEKGRWYLVMDYIEGQTLDAYLEQQPEGVLPLPEVIAIGLQLCDVLSYLHNRRPPIIFRDLKPDNIMITPDGQLFLIDFGLARLFKPGKEHDTSVLWTPGFAPPEQYGRGQTTAASDIYSLGATLYNLATGNLPLLLLPMNLQPVNNATKAFETLINRMLFENEKDRPANVKVVKRSLQMIAQMIGTSSSSF